MELLDLDEDSLMEIFSYFSFDELLMLSAVCGRFLQLCQRHLRKIRHFELDYRAIAGCENYEQRLQNIFRSLGPSMVAFRLSAGYIMDEKLKQTIVDNLARYCTSLRHLTINYTVLTELHLRPLAVLLRTLVTLDLGRCDLTDASLAEFLQSQPTLQLRTLAIAGNPNLSGAFFANWTNCPMLEQLDLSYCFSLNVDMMEEFLKHAKRLAAVDATGSLWLQRNKDIFHKEGRSITMGTELPELTYFKSG
ncbi:F-box/LRR-repeat protein 15-like [Anopheles ziemanni]|uniref:F-box/LRR-repeat protein 15-like n=1 Tax=Anopheles coustani TaxID=139045 RepID=UPI0026598EB2|nr:F-box/LRR-repeat protein 15-like [Anopheles coustani]XP_058166944.1 F-box/LRR-repeat protein 15-like [Anopheles ziemanni]